jgi:hypothetical protein
LVVGPAGIPSGVVALFVIFAFIAIGSFVVRISLASRMAQRAKLDPTDAAMTTALSQDGLAATYVAASLAGRTSRDAPGSTTEARLRELDRIHAQGLVNDEEYTAQRTRILNSL